MVSADSEQQRATKKTEETKTAREKVPSSNISKKGEKLKEDMDRIIEEIDEVLEENAEDFVRNYIQRGGQ
ncbi:MAG: ubiquitin-like protein Pup [Candidatus Aenigmatarchaeota archaeon]